MAITTANYETGVFSNREVEEQQKHSRETPKLYRFTWFSGNEQYKTGILAHNEGEAQLLFDLLARESGLTPKIENQEMMGICDFVSPDLNKFYKKKISMHVYDAYFKILRDTKTAQEKHAQTEQQKRKGKAEQKKEQQFNHALDVLAQAAAYAKKLMFAKENREKEQEADRSAWMKSKNE